MIPFRVQPDDAEVFEVVADSRDVIRWEVAGRGRHLGMIQATPRMSDLSELAWLAATRTKRWTGDLEEFRRVCAVSPIAAESEDDDLLDPTHAGA